MWPGIARFLRFKRTGPSRCEECSVRERRDCDSRHDVFGGGRALRTGRVDDTRIISPVPHTGQRFSEHPVRAS